MRRARLPSFRSLGAHRAAGRLLVVPIFGALLITALWVGLTLRVHQAERSLTEAALREAESIAATFEQRTIRTLQGADRTTALIKWLWERDGKVDLAAAVRDGLIPSDAYLVASLVDRNGTVVASTEPDALGKDMGDRPYFQRHAAHDSGKLEVSAPTALRVSGKSAIQLTRRINTRSGDFAGMVVLAVDPAFFTDFYDDTGLGSLGILGLVGTDGVFRARRVGHSATAAPGNSATQVLARAAHSPSGAYEGPSPLDGVERFVAYRTLRDYPFVVMAAEAKDEVFAAPRRVRDKAFVAAGLASVGIVLFCVVVTLLIARLHQRERQAVERAKELRLASTVFEATADAIVLTDGEDRILRVNPAFSRLTGFAPDQVVGLTVDESPFRPIDPEASARRKQRWLQEGFLSEEVSRVTADGTLLHLWLTATCMRDATGTVVNHVRVFSDISRLKESHRKIEHLARSDVLTGLPNRRAFYERLEDELGRGAHPFLLLFLDLDGFKTINDTLGHDGGDRVLQEVAVRLKSSVRSTDVVGRLGGDEFTVLLPDVSQSNRGQDAIQRIVEHLSAPIEVNGIQVFVRASIGTARFPEDGRDADVLLKAADRQMYSAKHAARPPDVDALKRTSATVH